MFSSSIGSRSPQAEHTRLCDLRLSKEIRFDIPTHCWRRIWDEHNDDDSCNQTRATPRFDAGKLKMEPHVPEFFLFFKKHFIWCGQSESFDHTIQLWWCQSTVAISGGSGCFGPESPFSSSFSLSIATFPIGGLFDGKLQASVWEDLGQSIQIVRTTYH